MTSTYSLLPCVALAFSHLPCFLPPHHSMCHATDHQKNPNKTKKQPSKHHSDRPHLFPVKSFICPYSTALGPITSTHFFFRSFVISGTACKHQYQGSACSPLTPSNSTRAVPSPAITLPTLPPSTALQGPWVTPAHSTPHFSPAE